MTSPDSLRWFVAGLGRAGAPLALVIARAAQLDGAWTRSGRTAARVELRLGCELQTTALPDIGNADVVLLAVPDDRIARVAAALPAEVREDPKRVWLHASGAHGSDILRDAGIKGSCGSCHPLLSLTGDAERDLPRLSGVFFAVEGDADAVACADWLARACGGRPQRIDADAKTAYHAAATVASNGVYALLELANRICASAGIDQPELREGLVELARGSAENAIGVALSQAATGPAIRGDAGTIAGHLGWFDRKMPHERELYVRLSEHLVRLATEGDRAGAGALAAVEAVLASAPKQAPEPS